MHVDLSPKSQTSAKILTATGSATQVASALAYGIYSGSAHFISGAVDQVAYVYNKLGGNILDLEITNYNVYDAAGNAAGGSSTVKFAGGSNPTLTTDANHVDIISFYWDNDNEIAYGVPT